VTKVTKISSKVVVILLIFTGDFSCAKGLEADSGFGFARDDNAGGLTTLAKKNRLR